MLAGARASSAACSACRSSILRTVISFSGAVVPHRLPARRLQVTSFAILRGLSTFAPLRTEEKETDLRDRDSDSHDQAERTVTVPAAADPAAVSAPTPWYLQNEVISTAPAAIAERQKRPDLPANPPPVLAALLQHVSVDLGLDDLRLLDLRAMNPPAALGQNLIMICGTARSERHLHVSADRFCRWLRSEFRLRPYADGLLGRNELKIKLRRQAKKVKLLRTAGTTATGEVESIRSGWICVNIGRVPGVRGASVASKDIVGFNESNNKVSLVVQMMIEEKRNELDLEGLWMKALTKQSIRMEKEAADEAAVSMADGEKPAQAGLNFRRTQSLMMSAQYPREDLERMEAMPKYNVEDTRRTGEWAERSEEELAIVWEELSETPDPTLVFGAENATAKSLLQALMALPVEDAKQYLGKSAWDSCSTAFLSDFYRSFSTFPSSVDWAHRLSLVAYGVQIAAPGYTHKWLIRIYREAIDSGLPITHDAYWTVFHSVCNEPQTPHSFGEALQILQGMAYSGVDISTDEVFISLFSALQANKSILTSTKDAVRALQRVSITVLPEPASNFLASMFLTYYAKTDRWKIFWESWEDLILQGKHRDAEMYELMFTLALASNDYTPLRKAIRFCFPEMEQEEPAIEWTPSLVASIQACLRKLRPDIQKLARDTVGRLSSAQKHANDINHWIVVWKICEEAETENWYSAVSKHQDRDDFGSIYTV